MKKYTFVTVIFCFTVFLFCCKTYQSKISPVRDEVFNDEVSAYLHSADGVMHDAPVAGKNKYAPENKPADQAALKKELRRLEKIEKENPAADAPVTKKEERKAIKSILKMQKGDDGDGVGIAIGLLILYLVLGALIIIGLIYLIAYAANNSSNSSSNGGSGSNSGSGNGGGSGSNSGCYVATMVYGSYDAPEVMILRKFRDETLAHSKAGRAFIKWYYGWSPGFVEKYHHLRWLHKFIKLILDRFVKILS